MPIISGGGGGYTPPTGRQLLTGNNVNIANGGVGLMTWNTSFGPNVLLDRSTLTSPAVLTEGIYAVSILVLSGAMTVGGTFQGVLELDWDNVDASITMDSATASAALTTPQLALTSVFYIPAGSSIRATVRNHDGVNAVDFGFTAQVQKIT